MGQQLFRNNARSTIDTALGIADTHLYVPALDASRFPAITGTDYFVLTLQDSTNIEIVKVTARVGNDMTIVRAQEDTAAAAFAIGAIVSLRLTAAVVEAGMAHASTTTGAHAATAISYAGAAGLSATNVEAALDELDSEKATPADITAAMASHLAAADPHTDYTTSAELAAGLATKQDADATLAALATLNTTAGLLEQTGTDTFTKRPISTDIKALLDAADAAAARTALGVSAITPLSAWPVGSVFTSVVSTDPATLLGGGTWVAFGAGRVLVGIDATQTEFDTVEKTGGAKTHTLTTTEMPSHTHTVPNQSTSTGGTSPGLGINATIATASTTSAAGGGAAHNNLQPYIVVYFWKRTA